MFEKQAFFYILSRKIHLSDPKYLRYLRMSKKMSNFARFTVRVRGDARFAWVMATALR